MKNSLPNLVTPTGLNEPRFFKRSVVRPLRDMSSGGGVVDFHHSLFLPENNMYQGVVRTIQCNHLSSPSAPSRSFTTPPGIFVALSISSREAATNAGAFKLALAFLAFCCDINVRILAIATEVNGATAAMGFHKSKVSGKLCKL